MILKFIFFLLISVGFTTSCKQSSSSSSSPATTAACTGQACANLAAEQSSCILTPGGKWDSIHSACQKPQSLQDCQNLSSSMVWNGVQCVNANALPNFYLICINQQTTGAQLATISVIQKSYPSGTSCQNMFDDLNSQSSLVFQGDQISDITPFQGFANLTSLDLWNNQISNFAPLANLPQLTSLNLAHNQISNIQAITSFKKLTTLYLFENQIVDISPLAQLTTLTYLDIRRNQITNLSPISHITYSAGLLSEENPSSTSMPSGVVIAAPALATGTSTSTATQQ